MQVEQVGRQTLRAWRKARRLSQVQLATAAQVGLTTVRSIEYGSGAPTIATVQKLAHALGVGIDWIEWPTERGQRGRKRPREDHA